MLSRGWFGRFVFTAATIGCEALQS